MNNIIFENHNLKLWQEPDGSLKASYGLDPAGFIFDDKAPTGSSPTYELHHLISNSKKPSATLAFQIENIFTDGKPDLLHFNKIAAIINEKIKTGNLNPKMLLAKNIKVLYDQASTTN